MRVFLLFGFFASKNLVNLWLYDPRVRKMYIFQSILFKDAKVRIQYFFLFTAAQNTFETFRVQSIRNTLRDIYKSVPNQIEF